MTGLETAELLAEQGNEVTVIEMAKELAPGLGCSIPTTSCSPKKT
jgi:pyruvate/2-oxoglutarate dehydrogenase complex dihydrolipoamide dehydrogenase (E3) component